MSSETEIAFSWKKKIFQHLKKLMVLNIRPFSWLIILKAILHTQQMPSLLSEWTLALVGRSLACEMVGLCLVTRRFCIPWLCQTLIPTHGRRRRIWRSHKCIRNAFVMFKYAIQFANTANSFPNLDFDNRYVGTTNFLGIFGICMTHKSLLSTRASDLYTWHILNLYFKFLLCANLMTNLEFPNEFAAIAYEFLYFNITIALRMHLRDVQIWRRLPCLNATIGWTRMG